jgi:hypothetical protein
MDLQPAGALLVHGSIVVLFGLLSGIPFWLAILRHREQGTIRAWRVAHTTLIAFGLLMVVVGVIDPHLALRTELRSLLVLALIVSGYGFVFALVIGAATGLRALTPKPWGFNTLLFLGHLLGATGSIIAMVIILYGLLRT